MTLPPSPRHEEGRPTTRARPHALTRAEGLLDGRPTSATNTQNRYSDRVHTDRPDRVCFCRTCDSAGSSAVEIDCMPTPLQRDTREPYHHSDERDMAMSRLRDHFRHHFKSYNAHNVGFHKHRDEHSGRFVQGLTGFVNHPTNVSRGEFIVTAFQDLKYVNAGMGELVTTSKPCRALRG